MMRIVIIDDDPFVREALATILNAQTDIEVRAQGGDGEEAVARYSEERPDIVLMDVRMPRMNGLEAAQAILTEFPDARIVLLTTFPDDEYIVSALRLGVKGYLIKQEVSTIVPALRAVMAGQTVLGEEVLGKMDTLLDKDDGFSQNSDDASRALAAERGLSEKEYDIVRLIAQGYDNKEIAAHVFAGEGTVRNHVSAILQKLGLKNRTQIAVFYYRELP